MKRKIFELIAILLLVIILLEGNVYAKSYSSTYFTVTIPDTYQKASTSNDANQYSEDYDNLKWDGNGYVNIEIFVLKQPASKKITQSDVSADATKTRNTLGSSVTCSFIHIDLVSVNGFQGKRLTYSGTVGNSYTFYEDEYTLLSNNYIYSIYFTTDKRSFIDSSEQKAIINSFKINDYKFSTFTDVKRSDWFYESVQYTYSNGIIAGYNDTTFAPNDKLSRAMIVTILYRMDGMPSNDGKSKFSDVPTNEWYSKAIKWATEKGIVHGYGGTNRFGPNDNIIRQDLVIIFRNYASYKKKNVNQTTSLTKFSDYRTIDSYATAAMQWAVKTGVITGNGNGTLNPKGNATRAETAALIQKYCNNVGR